MSDKCCVNETTYTFNYQEDNILYGVYVVRKQLILVIYLILLQNIIRKIY